MTTQLNLFGNNEGEGNSLLLLEGILLKALQRFAPSHSSARNGVLIARFRNSVVTVNDAIVLKYGREVTQREAEVMKFVFENTNIPVPEVLGTLTEDGETVIVMKLICGEMIGKAWPSLSDGTKLSLALEMRSYLNELRSFQAPYIGSYGRAPYPDLAQFGPPFDKPFTSVSQMKEAFLEGYEKERGPSFCTLLRKILRDDYRIVFTHSDLNIRNILVRDGHIVAILDWETAGFFPEYWEFAEAMRGVIYSDLIMQDWAIFLETCLTPYHVEAKVHLKILWALLGPC